LSCRASDSRFDPACAGYVWFKPAGAAFTRFSLLTGTGAGIFHLQEATVMSGDRSVNAGRDLQGNVVVTGDRNSVRATLHSQFVRTTLPPAASVDISQELAQIRAILNQLGGEHATRIGRALDDAAEETTKPTPDRDEIGTALSRALDYATKTNGFAEQVGRLAPHVRDAVGWLGDNWHKLLPLVGLAL
jgi:hypothetical protein